MHLLRTFTYACAVAAISFILPLGASAQSQKPAQDKKAEADTVPLLKGVSVSYDLAGTVMRLVGDYGQVEGALRFNLRDRYFPIAEIGWGTAHHDTDPVTGLEAKTNAPYGKLGCDINISKNKHDDYRVLIGARYGFTNFKQEITGKINVPYWGGTTDYATNGERISYHWAELVFSVDAKLVGPVRLGWSFRYKLKISGNANDGEKIWYVPGYGRDGDKLGGTFNVSIELARKNKKLK